MSKDLRRRLIQVVIALAAASVITPSAAWAGFNQGYNFITNSCCSETILGARSSIDPPGFNFQPGYQHIALAGVGAGYCGTCGSFMWVQAGMAQTDSINFEDCGVNSTLRSFGEWHAYGTGPYHCLWIGSGIGTDATPHKYSVISPLTCASCWQIFVDGVLKKQVELGVGQADLLSGMGEISSCGGCAVPHGGMVEACFACANGDTAWQRYMNDGSYYTIANPNHNQINHYGEWIISGFVSPWRVHHDL